MEGTQKSTSDRIRAWCFTLNNWTETDQCEDALTSYFREFCKYAIFGIEVGASGTPHLQGYFYRKNPISLGGLKKIYGLGRAHFEPAQGTAEQNKAYCSKGLQPHDEWKKFGVTGVNYGRSAKVIEVGDIGTCGQGKRTDISTVREMIKEGKSMSDVIEVATSYQSMRAAEMMLKYIEIRRERRIPPKILWFYGPTGTGKTRTAVEICEKNEEWGMEYWMSSRNLKWWDGYDAHPVVIIDDYRRDFCTFHELLRITDRYHVRVEVKGGSRSLLAQFIIITTPHSFKETWQGRTEEEISQMQRRIDLEIKFPITEWPIRIGKLEIGQDLGMFVPENGTEVGGNTSPPL